MFNESKAVDCPPNDKRVLFTGNGTLVINDLMGHMPEGYQSKKSLPDGEDFMEKIKTFHPHAIVICLMRETLNMLSMYNILENSTKLSLIPVIITGAKEECDFFEQNITLPNMAFFIRPLKTDNYLTKLDEFARLGFEKEQAEEAERIEEEKAEKAADAENAEIHGVKAVDGETLPDLPDIDESLLAVEDISGTPENSAAAAQMVFAASSATDPGTHDSTASKGTSDIDVALIKNRKTILVVDDDVRMLNVIKLYLQDLFEVVAVPSGKLALKYLSKRAADLVLLDYMMPEEDGPAVLKKIREESPFPDIPVLFLTSVAEKDLVLKCLELRPNGYCLKPVTQDELLDRITAILLGL